MSGVICNSLRHIHHIKILDSTVYRLLLFFVFQSKVLKRTSYFPHAHMPTFPHLQILHNSNGRSPCTEKFLQEIYKK